MDTVISVFIALCALGTLGLSAVFAFTLITLIGKAKGELGGVSGESENPSVSSADLVEDDGEELVWDDIDALGNDALIDYDYDPGEFDFDPVFDPWLA